MTIAQMIESAPQKLTVDASLVTAAIEAANACAVVCSACATACLSEDDPGAMAGCIRDDLDCADVCAVTARHLARLNASDKQLTVSLLGACIEACVQCAASCEEHAGHHDHCRLCAQACRACEEACQQLLDGVKAV